MPKIDRNDSLTWPEARKVWQMENGAYPISLFQFGNDYFAVSYGAQYNASLTYKEAADELGRSIMHSLTCEGKIDR